MNQSSHLQPADHETISEDTSQFGRFVLLELLSEDGDGQLYRAMHQRLRKQVALKLFHPRYNDPIRSREQYLSHCRVLCELSHSNLVRVETAGEHDEVPYLVLEFVPGFDLQRIVNSVGTLKIADACQLIGQAAIGLGHLHEHGLIHGQITLEGLVLTPSSRLKLVGLERASQLESPLQVARDRRHLAKTFCDLVGCPYGFVFDELPTGLADAIHRLLSVDANHAIDSPRQFIDVLARFSVGSDLLQLLRQLDVTPAAGSSDVVIPKAPEYLHDSLEPVEKPIVQDKQRALVLAPLITTMLIVCTAFAGSQWWTSDDPVLDAPARGRVAVSGPKREPANSITTSPINDPGWVSPAASSVSNDLHKTSDQSHQLLASLDSERDAFNMRIRSTDFGTEFENLESRGIVQFPVIMPERYMLTYTVERIAGEGSFGFGFSAGKGRMMALIDHKVDDRWQSGIFFSTSDGKSQIIDPYTDQILATGVPVRITLDVSPEHVELKRTSDLEVDTSTTKISQWTAADNPATSPLLAKNDAYYPQTFFVHAFQGAFRVDDLQILDPSADLVPQPFHGPGAALETRLAQRIVWRGGHVEIMTDTGTRIVHRLQQLTDEPWLVGVDKCPSASKLMIGDAELSQLTTINGIQKLDLTDSQVTMEGVSRITGLGSLELLALPRKGIDGSVLASLRDLPALRQLQLIGVSLTDDDMDELARFPELTSLCLSGCPITDKAVQRVARLLPELQHLCLSGTKISGDCLPELASLRSLRDLQLHETSVDDGAIANLPSLPQLIKLTLKDSMVSAATIEKLQREHPGIEIQ